MRYAKRILVAAAIFSSYSATLAFDKKEIDSAGSSSKKSTDSGAPAAKSNAPTASGSGYAAKAGERLKVGRPVLVVQQLSSGSSTLSSNKDISITTFGDEDLLATAKLLVGCAFGASPIIE
jgi:hypothetical protein